MGLILPQEVEVKVDGSSKSYYKKLGYDIPVKRDRQGRLTCPKGTKIKVKVSDLPKNSHTKVKVKCDNCNKPIDVEYQVYNTHNHSGDYYCIHCSSKVLLGREKSPNWKHDKSDEDRQDDRSYQEYKDFVKKVLIRDNYTCISCGEPCKNNAQVHHLYSYSDHPELRTSQDNGVTLCDKCHKNFHMIYGKGGNTKEQFEEWLKGFKQKENYQGEIPTSKKVYLYEEDKIFNSAEECARYLSVDHSAIYGLCNYILRNKACDNKEITNKNRILSVKGKHVFWLQDYEKMTEEEIKEILNRKDKKSKSVVCLNTLKIYSAIKDVKLDYKTISVGDIYRSCKDRKKYCGKNEDGEPLYWMYYEDYIVEQGINKKEVI